MHAVKGTTTHSCSSGERVFNAMATWAILLRPESSFPPHQSRPESKFFYTGRCILRPIALQTSEQVLGLETMVMDRSRPSKLNKVYIVHMVLIC